MVDTVNRPSRSRGCLSLLPRKCKLSIYLVMSAALVMQNLRAARAAAETLHASSTTNSHSLTHDSLHGQSSQPPPPCALYVAPSTKYGTLLGLFAGVPHSAGEPLKISHELLVELFDANKNEWSPWRDYFFAESLFPSLDHDFERDLFLPGISSMITCHDDDLASNETDVNLIMSGRPHDDSFFSNIHRAKDPAAGSFTYHSGFTYEVLSDVSEGQELFVSCHAPKPQAADNLRAKEGGYSPYRRSLEGLAAEGICVDALDVRPSSIPGIGRGTFSRFDVSVGKAIAVSPVLHFDRSQMHRVAQHRENHHFPHLVRPSGIEYHADHVLQQQLMLNYCYSHKDSNVLLLPIGLGVNAINHSPTPNAYLRWKPSAFGSSQDMLQETPHEILAVSASMEVGPESDQLWIEIVAMKQIRAGDEVFLDYGADWQRAWELHEEAWSSQLEPEELSYVSAATYLNDHANDPIPTQVEQSAEPLPDNLRTACIFRSSEDTYNEEEAPPTVEYTANPHSSPFCLRPCDILDRVPSSDGESSSTWLYTAQVYNRPSITDSGHPCGLLPADGLRVSNMPSAAVTVVDKPYTNDALMRQAFRHEIGVPSEGFWPAKWMKKDPKSLGDFIPTPLGPGEMQIIRWADTGEVVTPNAYRLGLRPRFTQVMLEYCEKMGIVDLFRHLTYKGNALDVGKEAFLTLDGEEWYLQRPGSKWNSNLQWLSPGGNPAHDHYLQALSVAGFDEILKGIGEYLQLESLVVFHVTFIAVSHSVRGYMHYDVTETQNKTFNVIVPLILANETGPELDLQSNNKDPESGEYPVGRYRYEPNVASMMGDDAMHASSATDYRTNKEMRLAATIYLAEVTEENADYIMQQYTQAFPPQDRDLLLSWSGRHWRRDDPTKKLPDPVPNHIMVKDLLAASAR